MNVTELELSHSVELEVKVDKKKTTLLSTIERIVDQTLLLAPMRSGGKLLGFPSTCTVDLIYPRQTNTYVWHNVFVRAVKFENVVYHAVTLDTEPSIVNRRGTYRVYSGEEMLITIFTSGGPKPLRVILKDISESGMAFFSKESLDVGRTIRLNLITQNGREIHLGAQIVRIKEGSRFGSLYGCKFVEKHPLLPNYLMRLQQEHQKKKMGF